MPVYDPKEAAKEKEKKGEEAPVIVPVTPTQMQNQAQKEAEERAKEKEKAPAKDAPLNISETVEGGKYEVFGKMVDSEGREIGSGKKTPAKVEE